MRRCRGAIPAFVVLSSERSCETDAVVVDIVMFAVGMSLVVGTLLSAVRTVVIPHGGSVRLTRFVFRLGRKVAWSYGRVDSSPSRQHAAVQVSVAAGLLALPVIWLSIAVSGYTLMFKALGTDRWRDAYDLAGSSMFTLGFAKTGDLPRLTLAFSASALCISILALLLVTYLPTIYSAYTARETYLTSFETLAGDPPNVAAMVVRAHELTSLDRLSVVWEGARSWFADLRESHTALPAVAFLGSSREDRNWVATVGTLLDSAAVVLAVLDHESESAADAALCVRSGTLALRDIAEYLGITVDHDPAPDDPISVDRSSFDLAYDQMAAAGVPLVDRDDAWRHWAGWRVNYDMALVGLAAITASPTSRLTAGATYRYSPADD
jgi:hypothetical protein